ncbi:hypothetical protein [Pseudarthrobacter sp. BIM B-2242]|uniref:hypothetical protein n=1 Tax=Pseudarthrobacter sp. BIM B-2242 TaxID=2772401 RepID=UPI00168BA5FD|nr:hypothetical protein [Pseudarthrobacter sp. BIM B-2242]QOD06037.1 hypothetical protein IDT60_20955 [Pseudarthrobacter sp. BIM B-2242]
MTDKAASRPRFARIWPFVHEVPNGLQTILPVGRVSVFNRGLTTEELKPLTESFQTPCGKAFKVVGQVFLWVFCAQGLMWAGLLGLDLLFNLEPPRPEVQAWITEHLTNTLNAARAIDFMVLAAMAPVLAVLYTIHFVAWRKWRASVAAAWEQAGNRLVHTRNLPGSRRVQVDHLGGKLDPAVRRLDPENEEHCRLVTEAVAAIGRYIDLPIPSEEARSVAKSKSQDPAVQKVRAEYEAAVAAERAALQEAEAAVLAVETLAGEVKAAKAEQKIIGIAKTILEGSRSR